MSSSTENKSAKKEIKGDKAEVQFQLEEELRLRTQELQQALAALSESEGRYGSLIANIPDVVWRADENGRAVYISPRIKEVFGFSPEEVYAEGEKLWLGRIHPDDLELVWKAYQNLFNHHRLFDVVYRYRHRDGRWIWIQDRAFTLYQQDGLNYADGTLSEITERMEVQQALKKEQERFRYVAMATRDAIYDWDIQSGSVWRNEAYQELYAVRERVGSDEKWWEERIHPDDKDRILTSIQKAFDSHESFWSGEYRFRRADGTFASIMDRCYVLYNEEDKPIRVIGAITDITHTRDLQKQLFHSQKMETIGQLAGGVAHDFNNLLMAITSYCELLKMKLGSNDQLQQYVAETLNAAQKGASLTHQLLAFGRKQTLVPQILNLADIFRQMEDMLKRSLGEEIELTFCAEPDLGYVRLDPVQIEQVILNLSLNARDAMPEGGRLTIDAKNVELDESFAQTHLGIVPGRYVMMQVADSGLGMDEAVKAHIFEPFFTTKEAGRSGLGLSTVFGIVHQSGGYITVSSKVGIGTTFEIYFPQIEEPRETALAPENLQPVEPLSIQETVLLVDDNEMVGRALSSLLEFHGYKVCRADGPASAIDLFQENSGKILALITDISMPGMSGLQLATQLRAIRPNLPVLYLSGYSDETALKGSQLPPGTAFLHKPVSNDALLKKLQKLLHDTR